MDKNIFIYINERPNNSLWKNIRKPIWNDMVKETAPVVYNSFITWDFIHMNVDSFFHDEIRNMNEN